jgi:hypothetical protein
MAWSQIQKGQIGEGAPCVRVGSTKRSKPAVYGQMIVHLSASVVRSIGIKPGDRIHLEVGTLADAGWMRISAGDQQKTIAHGHDGSARVRFSGRRFGVIGSHKPEDVKYQVGEKNGRWYVNFMLPKWAREETNGGS